MLKYVFIGWIGLLSWSSWATPLDEVRNKFPYYETEAEVDQYLTLLASDTSALATVYKGALYMFKSKFSSFPTMQYKYFKKGKNLINSACQALPNAMEIRFIRLVFQYQLPGFLGYNDHKESDFKFFISNYSKSELTAERKLKLKLQLLLLEKLEPEKIKQLKQL